ncbi:MAG: MBL fold metallo-hydrolase [Patescibacteria group bacterium]
MTIKKYILGELRMNSYLLVHDNECILIDPGDEAGFLLEEISRMNLRLIAMCATHGHFDHIMAAGEVQLSLKIPLYIHKDDLFLVKRLKSTVTHYLGKRAVVVQPSMIRNINTTPLRFGNWKFRIFFTPGHTPGGVCYYLPEEQILFTGDTLFKNAVGRTDLSYSSSDKLHDSINQLIKSVPEETVIYPGHGQETTIFSEKIYF